MPDFRSLPPFKQRSVLTMGFAFSGEWGCFRCCSYFPAFVAALLSVPTHCSSIAVRPCSDGTLALSGLRGYMKRHVSRSLIENKELQHDLAGPGNNGRLTQEQPEQRGPDNTVKRVILAPARQTLPSLNVCVSLHPTPLLIGSLSGVKP